MDDKENHLPDNEKQSPPPLTESQLIKKKALRVGKIASVLSVFSLYFWGLWVYSASGAFDVISFSVIFGPPWIAILSFVLAFIIDKLPEDK